MPQNPFQAALENLRKVGQGVYRPRPDTALLSANELAPRRPLTDLTGEPGGSPVEQDPSSTDYLYKTRLADETKDRLFNATRAEDPNEAAALKGLLGTTEQDIKDSPITQQRVQGEDYLAKQRAARTVGFHSSQEQGQFGQRLETSKVTGPVDIARISAAGDLAKQQEASRGALAVAESQGSQAKSFLDMLNTTRASGGDVRGVTLPKGGGSISFAPQQQTPPGLLNEVTVARNAYEQAKKKSWFGKEPAAEKAVLRQAISNALLKHPAPPALKEFYHNVKNDPRTANLSLEEVLRTTGQTDITPDEHQALQELFDTFGSF